jgi:hypothetical protein
MDAIYKNDYKRTKCLIGYGAKISSPQKDFNSVLWTAFDKNKDSTKIYKFLMNYEEKFSK